MTSSRFRASKQVTELAEIQFANTKDRHQESLVAKQESTNAIECLDISFEDKVWALSAAGFTPAEIARDMSLTLKERVPLQRVKDAIQSISEDKQRKLSTDLGHHLVIDLDRIEMLIKATWPMAMAGNLSAATFITGALKRKAELLGLDAPEVRMNITGNAFNYDALSIDELILFKELLEKVESRKKQVRDIVIDAEIEDG
jgi:hypothetical protein